MKNKDLEMNLVKKWGSPRSNVQLFVPQEFVATCSTGGRLLGWKAYGGMMINERTIYHDTDGNGRHPILSDREDVSPNSGNVPLNASSNNDEYYIQSTNLPIDISSQGGVWYRNIDWVTLLRIEYRNPISPLFEYDGHYFTSYEPVYSAS